MTDDQHEKILYAVADLRASLDSYQSQRMEVLLRLVERDPHQFSSRPCQTCNAVSLLAGRPYECNARKR